VVLQGDSPEAYNDLERPERVVPEKTKIQVTQGLVELPPHSLTILKISHVVKN
jgi:alpha-L-arabinofuranosidase